MLPATAAVLALSLGLLYRGCVAAPLSSEEIITQIQSLALLHRENSTLILSTYLQQQGLPFSAPGFSFPYWLEKGLPTAALGFRTWRCLCPGERLLQARDAFSAISEFFQLVLDDQNSLNPTAADLLHLLEVAQRASEALLRNLKDALVILGFQPPSSQPEPLSWAQADDNAFKKKVRGYVLCREYRDWLVRLPEDMKILRTTWRIKNNSGQEKKDCCRS